MSKRRSIFIIMAALLLLLTSCSSGGQVMDGEDMVRSYTQISQDEAKQMMEQDGTQIFAYQASKRGGYLYCELREDGRINISGKAALVAVSDIVAEL